MAGNLTAMIAAIFSGSAVSTDPYFNYNTLLLSTTATNGQQNNTFLDSSTNNFTITRNPATGPNAPTQGTFSPFSQTGWSNYFDGAGDFINTPATGQFAPAGDFTIRFYFYLTSLAAINHLVGNYTSTAPTDWLLQVTTTGVLEVYTNGSTLRLSQSGITANRWYYVTVTRSGATITGQLDGTNFNTTATYTQSGTFGTATKSIFIGQRANAPLNPLTGYLSNVSLVDGSAIQTVPTAPLTDVTGTKLLTCQSNRFVDNSSSPNTLTIGGNTTVVPFSPFNPTSAWSASTVGGSGYFDGTGDYLSGSTNLWASNTSTFTVDGWVYPTSVPGAKNMLLGDFSPTGAALYVGVYINSSRQLVLEWYDGATKTCTSTSTINLNEWSYVAVRVSSNAISMYVNSANASGLTGTTTLTNRSGTTNWALGQYASASNWNGYASNIRMSTIARTISIPTTPFTSDANTKLLLNFTNSGICDATAKNVLETVGDAQASTTITKWSPTSMKFDGTGDYAVTPASPLNAFLTGDFTCEFWVYFNALATNQTVMGTASGFQTGGYQWIQLASNTLTFRMELTSGAINVATGALSTGQWYHIAATRSGTTVRVFVNGVLANSTTTGGSISDSTGNKVIVGNSVELQATRFFNGYLQDVRVTRGYARYTANFTPPTAAFPVQ